MVESRWEDRAAGDHDRRQPRRFYQLTGLGQQYLAELERARHLLSAPQVHAMLEACAWGVWGKPHAGDPGAAEPRSTKACLYGVGARPKSAVQPHGSAEDLGLHQSPSLGPIVELAPLVRDGWRRARDGHDRWTDVVDGQCRRRSWWTLAGIVRCYLEGSSRPSPRPVETPGLELRPETGGRSGTFHEILARFEDWGWLASRWEDSTVANHDRWAPRRFYQLAGLRQRYLAVEMEGLGAAEKRPAGPVVHGTGIRDGHPAGVAAACLPQGGRPARVGWSMSLLRPYSPRGRTASRPQGSWSYALDAYLLLGAGHGVRRSRFVAEEMGNLGAGEHWSHGRTSTLGSSEAATSRERDEVESRLAKRPVRLRGVPGGGCGARRRDGRRSAQLVIPEPFT
jgi:hypothetical protein